MVRTGNEGCAVDLQAVGPGHVPHRQRPQLQRQALGHPVPSVRESVRGISRSSMPAIRKISMVCVTLPLSLAPIFNHTVISAVI